MSNEFRSLPLQEIDRIHRDFHRCGPTTVEAVLAFRRDRSPAHVPEIVRGIVLRYLRLEDRAQSEKATPETPLLSLGVDSLTMLEIVFDVQEALEITIEDAELKQLQKVGDVHELLATKLAGGPASDG